MLGILIAMSTVVWFVVDRLNTVFNWKEKLSWGNWLSTIIVACLATIAVVTYQLDLFVACEICADVTFFGCLMSVLVVAGGSSCIAEVIKKLKANGSN